MVYVYDGLNNDPARNKKVFLTDTRDELLRVLRATMSNERPCTSVHLMEVANSGANNFETMSRMPELRKLEMVRVGFDTLMDKLREQVRRVRVH